MTITTVMMILMTITMVMMIKMMITMVMMIKMMITSAAMMLMLCAIAYVIIKKNSSIIGWNSHKVQRLRWPLNFREIESEHVRARNFRWVLWLYVFDPEIYLGPKYILPFKIWNLTIDIFQAAKPFYSKKKNEKLTCWYFQAALPFPKKKFIKKIDLLIFSGSDTFS